MTDTKPCYLSRTIWASIVTTLTGAAGLAGLHVGGLDSSALTDSIFQVVTAVSGVVAIFGRLSAQHKIG